MHFSKINNTTSKKERSASICEFKTACMFVKLYKLFLEHETCVNNQLKKNLWNNNNTTKSFALIITHRKKANSVLKMSQTCE